MTTFHKKRKYLQSGYTVQMYAHEARITNTISVQIISFPGHRESVQKCFLLKCELSTLQKRTSAITHLNYCHNYSPAWKLQLTLKFPNQSATSSSSHCLSPWVSCASSDVFLAITRFPRTANFLMCPIRCEFSFWTSNKSLLHLSGNFCLWKFAGTMRGEIGRRSGAPQTPEFNLKRKFFNKKFQY